MSAITVERALWLLLEMPIGQRDEIVAAVEAELDLDLPSKDLPRAWLANLACAVPNYERRREVLDRHISAPFEATPFVVNVPGGFFSGRTLHRR